MTYLQAINQVMRRLRESEVSTYNETTYSTLIGDFVNDSRQYVSERWDWLSLEEKITITTSSGNDTYALDGAGSGGTVTQLIDITNNTVLIEWPIDHIRQEENISSPANGKPTHYAYVAPAADLDPQIKLRVKPAGEYTLYAYIDKSDVALTADTDVLVIPSQPVVQMAYALALDERGSTGGSSGRNQHGLAETYIANAIMADAEKRPASTVWEVAGDNTHLTNWNQ
mgnify:CR=1 FL=1